MFSRLSSKRDPEAAFTLAELMVSIVIIGIIMAIAVPLYNGAREGAKRTRLQQDVTTSALNVNTYYTRYGRYPSTTEFNSQVASVSTPSEETLSFTNPNATGAQVNQAYVASLCVSGTSNISGKTYTYSYNLAQRKLVTGACPAVAGTDPEPVS